MNLDYDSLYRIKFDEMDWDLVKLLSWIRTDYIAWDYMTRFHKLLYLITLDKIEINLITFYNVTSHQIRLNNIITHEILLY